MRKFVEKERKVEALFWNGFSSLPELVELRGDMVNVLLRHDESVLIFDNAFNLSQYITLVKGSWLVKIDDEYCTMKDKEFHSKYVEVTE